MMQNKLFINGDFVDAQSGETFPTTNPATEEKITDVASAGVADVDAAVREIHEWGNSAWAVAVQPSLGQEVPADQPDLDPIWRAAEDHGLPIIHHSSTWNPPYYPGYRAVWGNIFLGRLASHPWGAMRVIA